MPEENIACERGMRLGSGLLRLRAPGTNMRIILQKRHREKQHSSLKWQVDDAPWISCWHACLSCPWLNDWAQACVADRAVGAYNRCLKVMPADPASLAGVPKRRPKQAFDAPKRIREMQLRASTRVPWECVLRRNQNPPRAVFWGWERARKTRGIAGRLTVLDSFPYFADLWDWVRHQVSMKVPWRW